MKSKNGSRIDRMGTGARGIPASAGSRARSSPGTRDFPPVRWIKDPPVLIRRMEQDGWGTYKPVFVFLPVYGVLLLWLLPKLSLWLDEVRDLIGVCRSNWPAFFQFIRENPGAVPLAYVIQRGSVQVLGLSAFSARLPSILCSLAGCIGIFALGRQARLRLPLSGVIAFATYPLQLRYALEARGYEVALALTILLTVLFFRVRERPQIGNLVLYALCAVAGVYTQPDAFFVPIAHFLSVALRPGQKDRRQCLRGLGITLVACVLLFLPWYFYASNAWRASIQATHEQGSITLRSSLMVARELTGMGYIGTVLCLILAGAAALDRERRGRASFWMVYFFVPVAGVLMADAVFGYFLATRQMIFALAPLSILVAMGLETVAARKVKLGFAFATAFLTAAAWSNISFFRRPREDWQTASLLLKQKADTGYCLLFSSTDTKELYTLFQPDLDRSQCPVGDMLALDSVALALSPYDLNKESPRIREALREAGLVREETLNPVGPQIETYGRGPADSRGHPKRSGPP